MIQKLFIFVLALVLVACSSEPPGVPVGFSTELRLRNENRLNMTNWNYRFYTGILQSDARSHLSGKMYLAFDTIYTSTLRKINHDPVLMLSNDKNVTVYDFRSDDYPSVFYSKREWFIYRTLVSELAYKQTVIIDVAGTDSTIIAGYFYSSKVNSLIK